MCPCWRGFWSLTNLLSIAERKIHWGDRKLVKDSSNCSFIRSLCNLGQSINANSFTMLNFLKHLKTFAKECQTKLQNIGDILHISLQTRISRHFALLCHPVMIYLTKYLNPVSRHYWKSTSRSSSIDLSSFFSLSRHTRGEARRDATTCNISRFKFLIHLDQLGPTETSLMANPDLKTPHILSSFEGDKKNIQNWSILNVFSDRRDTEFDLCLHLGDFVSDQPIDHSEENDPTGRSETGERTFKWITIRFLSNFGQFINKNSVTILNLLNICTGTTK